jgi:hypothetical protein
MNNPPRWDRIEVNRLSALHPETVFRKGPNDWNHFTLLEAIINYYRPAPGYVPEGISFPDLARVLIVRPSHGSTNENRMTVNLLDRANGVDCSKDVPLEFGDRVEIPQREHSLGEPAVRLTGLEFNSICNCLKGNVQLIVHDQKAELPLAPFPDDSSIGAVLRQTEAQKLILSSSDLARVQVTRRDPKTGEKRQWTLDCAGLSGPSGGAGFLVGVNYPPSAPPGIPPPPARLGLRPGADSTPDLRLRDGDVIEIPEKL